MTLERRRHQRVTVGTDYRDRGVTRLGEGRAMTNRSGVRIRVLGPIRVDDDGTDVPLTPQLRRLIGLLVVADGGVVSPSRIAECVFDGPQAGSAVRTAVSRLRKVVGQRVESIDGGYRLRVDPTELDAARFEQLISSARATDDDEVAALGFAAALDLWDGLPFAELADEVWATAWAARLHELRAGAVEDLAEALVAVGRARKAVDVLEPHLVEQPYRERPVATMMRALASDGRVADALRVFERFRVGLRDDLGLEPSSDLRDLESEILHSDSGNSPSARALALPTGTVTFLFTDVEGSTRRWADDEAAMAAALAEHDSILREVVSECGGVVFKHTGDGICAVFASPTAAVSAASAAQQRLALPVRMGVHTGEATLRDGDYFGPTLNRVARIMDAGHGGQVLISQATAGLIDVRGVDLGEHRLKGLATPERICQVGDGEFPALRVASEIRGSLPTETTSFVGRDLELADLVERISSHRLVTLIGVGGTGKTRLAVEAARVAAPTFPDGCWFAQLAPVAVDEAVPFAALAGLGIPSPTASDVTDHLVQQIRHRRLLLIVDNCEHLLRAAADLIDQIVERCPTVTVVATSREPLMLNGEHLVPTPSLDDDGAERLFAERALAESPTCLDDPRQRDAVGAICRRLDGLPLAIELAASRVRSFTPLELSGMLDERFRLLVGGRRSRMERHQTMLGTLDWSYDLCTDMEQMVFDRLSMFAGRFTLDQAHEFLGDIDAAPNDVTDAVTSLVDRSLVQTTSGFDGSTRFGMLETMRAYGGSHLHDTGELDQWRERHARHVVSQLSPLYDLGPREEWSARRRAELLPEALRALDWFVERADWSLALDVCRAGLGFDDRAVWDMTARVHAAMVEAGCDEPLLRVVRDADMHWKLGQPIAEIEARSWEYLRSGEQLAFGLAGVEATPRTTVELRELLALIGERTFEGGRAQFVRFVFAVRHALLDGVGVPPDVWDQLEARVAALSSRSAERSLCEARGLEAMLDERFDDAVAHFRLALPDDDTVLQRGWLHVATRWSLADASAFAGQPLPMSHLVETWEILERHGVMVLTERGCVATAITARALGHLDLAERLVSWGHLHDPGGLMSHFGPLLERAGLHDVAISEEGAHDLVALLADVRHLAALE